MPRIISPRSRLIDGTYRFFRSLDSVERIAEWPLVRGTVGISRLHQRQSFCAGVARRYARASRSCRSSYTVPDKIAAGINWPCSPRRVHRSTFCSCNTRPDTDRRAVLGRSDRPAAREHRVHTPCETERR